jgi:hypothetical protein
MQKSPVSEFRKFLMSADEVAAEITAAIQCSALCVRLSAAYPELMEAMVLKTMPQGCEPKEIVRYRKQLLDEEAYEILLIIWRESGFVLDEHLQHTKLERRLSGKVMTAYRLATKLAESAEDLSRVSSRIQSIALAAEAYGLIERETTRGTSRPLIATDLLHRLILELAKHQKVLISEYQQSVSLGQVDLGLQQQQQQ